MMSSLWVLKQFAHQIPTPEPSGCFVKETLEFFHNSLTKVPSRHFVKEPSGFFHNSLCNVPIKNLSHSFRVLSKSTHWCDHNIPSGVFSNNSQRIYNVTQFHHKLSKNSLDK